MDKQKLEVVSQEQDLGVVISNDLKASQQCQYAYNVQSVQDTGSYRSND